MDETIGGVVAVAVGAVVAVGGVVDCFVVDCVGCGPWNEGGARLVAGGALFLQTCPCQTPMVETIQTLQTQMTTTRRRIALHHPMMMILDGLAMEGGLETILEGVLGRILEGH